MKTEAPLVCGGFLTAREVQERERALPAIPNPLVAYLVERMLDYAERHAAPDMASPDK